MEKRSKSQEIQPPANNAFLNYIQEYRSLNPGIPLNQATEEAASAWAKLAPSQRNMYCEFYQKPPVDACRRKSRKRKRRSCGKRKKRRSCRSRKRRSASRRCRRKRTSCRRKKRRSRSRRSRCRSRRRNRPGCARKKCSKPGPVTANGYLNFLRWYRRRHCGLKPHDLIQKAARAWCRLPERKKERFNRMACKVTKSCTHKQKPICQRK